MQTSSALLLSMLNLLVNWSSSCSWSNDSCTNIKLLLPMCHWVPLKRGVADRKLLLCSEIFSPYPTCLVYYFIYPLSSITVNMKGGFQVKPRWRCVVTIIQKWILIVHDCCFNYLFFLCNWFRPAGRFHAASDGAMCWELLAAGRLFSRVLGTSWSCEGELGTSWLLKGRLYFQKCCHHLLLLFQADENMYNPFESWDYSIVRNFWHIWHHVTWRTDRAKSFQGSALLGCCLKIFNLLFYVSESWSCFQ